MHTQMCIHMCTCMCTRVYRCVSTNKSCAKDTVFFKRDNILQKRPIILRSLLIVATSYAKAYGVATISGLLKITGLFCKRALHKRLYSADYILQKKPIILRSLLIVATPYVFVYIPSIFMHTHTVTYDVSMKIVMCADIACR